MFCFLTAKASPLSRKLGVMLMIHICVSTTFDRQEGVWSACFFLFFLRDSHYFEASLQRLKDKKADIFFIFFTYLGTRTTLRPLYNAWKTRRRIIFFIFFHLTLGTRTTLRPIYNVWKTRRRVICARRLLRLSQFLVLKWTAFLASRVIKYFLYIKNICIYI